MDHKLFYLYFTGGHKWHYLSRKKGEARNTKLKFRDCTSRYRMSDEGDAFKEKALDLAPLMCRERDAQGASLV